MVLNDCYIELDRALENVYMMGIRYSTVYIDYDDTVLQNGKVNTYIVKFLYQCINNKKNLVLLSKHDGNLDAELRKYRLRELFDNVIHIDRKENKQNYI